MRIFFICAIFLIALGQSTPCIGEQRETIPNVNLKWAIRPFPYVGYPPYCERFLTSTGIYGLDVDSRDGHVIRTYVIQRSISKLMDDRALQAFMRFRFRPGCPPRVKIPVTWKHSN
jgi:hypothetical protein